MPSEADAIYDLQLIAWLLRHCPDEDPDECFVCYFCKDYGDHGHCVGVPCHCPCPGPDQREMGRLRRQGLAKLTAEEREALGVYE